MTSRTPQSTPFSSPQKGYSIAEGQQLISPRRQGFLLGPMFTLTPAKLHEIEQAVKTQSSKEGRTPAETVRRMAGARAEIRAGYAVDDLHEWNRGSVHSSYIQNVEPRTAASSMLMEDIFDALHALDRISDAAILCVISPRETSRNGIATLHQFASRNIFRNPKAHAIVEAFRNDLAQPHVHKETQRINLHPFIPPSRPDSIEDLTNHLRRSRLDHQVNDPLSDALFAPSTSPTPSRSRQSGTTDISSPSSSSSSTAHRHNATHPRSLTDALTFGESVEKAFKSLGVSEVTKLKIMLISFTAQKESWRPMFEELGLSTDAAKLISIIIRDARRG